MQANELSSRLCRNCTYLENKLNYTENLIMVIQKIWKRYNEDKLYDEIQNDIYTVNVKLMDIVNKADFCKIDHVDLTM